MAKSNAHHTLIFDPITFKGGSKLATAEILRLCKTNSNHFVIATVQPTFWKNSRLAQSHSVEIVTLALSKGLAKQHYGILYWLNQFYTSLLLLCLLVKYRDISRAIGASGPGMDMALYLVNIFKHFELIQFVHGPVGNSRSIGYCLTRADKVFHLPSSKPSMAIALDTYLKHKTGIEDCQALIELYLTSSSYHEFVNGLTEDNWPTRSQTHFPVCYWAASLLKWKGLDTFVDALKDAAKLKSLAANICFIRPVDTSIPVSTAPISMQHVNWYQDPPDLDSIRSQSNIFVSTSQNEPFGLSILEALAAGMCVIIPQDGSYWDERLIHNKNCIKYLPNNPHSLCDALLYAAKDTDNFHQCIKNGLKVAQEYKAEKCYLDIIRTINGNPDGSVSRTSNPVRQ